MPEFLYQLLLTFDATLRLAAPLILCAMAGIFSERSGVIDISLEGKMLASAFVAAAVAHLAGSPWIGLDALPVGTAIPAGQRSRYSRLRPSFAPGARGVRSGVAERGDGAVRRDS